jgi:hypothetical protein
MTLTTCLICTNRVEKLILVRIRSVVNQWIFPGFRFSEPPNWDSLLCPRNQKKGYKMVTTPLPLPPTQTPTCPCTYLLACLLARSLACSLARLLAGLLAGLLACSIEQTPSWEANRFSASQSFPRILWNQKVHQYDTFNCNWVDTRWH